jgi:hypothetical protein
MPKLEPMKVVPFRLPVALVKRLDRYAESVASENPGLRVTRADALRLLLTDALDRKESKRGKA